MLTLSAPKSLWRQLNDLNQIQNIVLSWRCHDIIILPFGCHCSHLYKLSLPFFFYLAICNAHLCMTCDKVNVSQLFVRSLLKHSLFTFTYLNVSPKKDSIIMPSLVWDSCWWSRCVLLVLSDVERTLRGGCSNSFPGGLGSMRGGGGIKLRAGFQCSSFLRIWFAFSTQGQTLQHIYIKVVITYWKI